MLTSHLCVAGRPILSPDRVYSADEIALFVGRSVRTLQNWRRIGAGPNFHRVYDTPIYIGRDVLQWLDMDAGDAS
jgi:hypothetical protein